MGVPDVSSPASTSSNSDRHSKSPGTGKGLQSVGPISLEPSPIGNEKTVKKRSSRFMRRFRAAVRSFPIIAPAGCKMPMMHEGRVHGGTRVTGTLYGQRRARIKLAIQESPRCLPTVVMELAVQTGKIFQEFREGIVRIALECEKQAAAGRRSMAEEPVWSMYWNGKKTGYGIRREATEEDLGVMQLLRAASMGVGVLPTDPKDSPEGDLVYMRATFERVVGSRDSETYYMLNPDDNTGPEVTIFFVRI